MSKTLLAAIAAVIVVAGGTGGAVYLATKPSNDNASTVSSSSGSPQSTSADVQSLPTAEPTQLRQQINTQNCISDTCLQVPNLNYPVSGLSQNAKDSLAKALDNEYKLQTYYQAVINKFGDKRPFSMVIGAEAQHVAVITALDQKYGISPSSNQYSEQSFTLSTFQAACQTSAGYEKDTVNLLNGLLPQVSNYPDITQVLTNIKDASQNSHLPAFEKCS